MFTQVVDTLFSRLQTSRATWKLETGKPMMPPMLNSDRSAFEEPQDLGIDYKALKRQALEEFAKRKDLIGQILPAEVRPKIQDMFEQRRFRISRSVWATIVYAYLGAHAARETNEKRLEVVESLKPLYFARVTSFIRETLELDHRESEQQIVRQAQCFWRNRRKMNHV
jgi:hypothetical protein